MSVEYFKQNDDYSCGIIAVINAVMWTGNNNFSFSEMFNQLKVIANTQENTTFGPFGRRRGKGTTSLGIHNAIGSRPELYLHMYIPNPSIKHVKKYIDQKMGVILTFKQFRQQGKGHAVFIFGRDASTKQYHIANFNGKYGEAITQVDSETLRRKLQSSKIASTYMSNMWAIRSRMKELQGRI